MIESGCPDCEPCDGSTASAPGGEVCASFAQYGRPEADSLSVLARWEAEGWEVDHERGEVSVDGSWLPVESLPQVLANYADSLREAHNDVKDAAIRLDAMRGSARVTSSAVTTTEDAR